MRFKQFLALEDEQVPPWRMKPAPMTIDEIIEWVGHNAIRHIHTDDYRIYRGVDAPHNVEGLYNGASLNRRAANTLNYLNLWMSNQSAWSKFPPRSKSFICTTDQGMAEDYGIAYTVIPMDSSNIGICPRSDLWLSFKDVLRVSSHNGLDGFMILTQFLMDLKTGKSKEVENNWDEFAAHLNNIDTDVLRQELKDRKLLRVKNKEVEHMLENFLDYMERNHFETGYHAFEHMFDPTRNGFMVEKSSAFDIDGSREVWMSDGILMVTDDTWEKIEEAFHL